MAAWWTLQCVTERVAALPERGAELALEDLAAAGLGQLVQRRDRPRHLVAGEVLAGVLDDRGLVEVRARAGRRRRRAPTRPTRRSGCRTPPPRRCRGAARARPRSRPGRCSCPRDDHVLLAVADVEEALVVAVGDVADGLAAVAVCPPRTGRAACSSRRTRDGLRTNSSPVAVGPTPVTTLPSSSYSRTSTIGASLPHEPGLRIWSSGRRIVFTPSSVEP